MGKINACNFLRECVSIKMSGGYTGGETPVPIPNTEVKPARADDTMIARSWESRSPPGIFFY